MGNAVPINFSESVGGMAVPIVATSTPGTLIHTPSGSASDNLWIYATNNDTGTHNLTIEWGASGTSNQITQAIPPLSGLTTITPMLNISNMGTSGLTVAGYSDSSSAISVFGGGTRYL